MVYSFLSLAFASIGVNSRLKNIKKSKRTQFTTDLNKCNSNHLTPFFRKTSLEKRTQLAAQAAPDHRVRRLPPLANKRVLAPQAGAHGVLALPAKPSSLNQPEHSLLRRGHFLLENKFERGYNLFPL